MLDFNNFLYNYKMMNDRKEYMRRYRRGNLKLLNQIAQWWEAHSDYMKKWREKHPDYFKRWYKKHCNYFKQWRKRNREYLKEYKREYMRRYRNKKKHL